MDLLTGNIRTLYFKFLSAAFGSALISCIYGMVDMAMVGQYQGPDGAAALAVVAPVWNIIYSLGLLTGIGGSVLFSARRGGGHAQGEDNQYFTAAVVGSGILAVLSWAWILLFEREVLLFFGADETLLPLAQAYLAPVRCVFPVFLLGQLVSSFLRNDARPGLATAAVLTGGIFNVFGDWFCVFVLDLGVFGAGLATATGAVISLAVMCSHFFSRKCTLHLVPVQKLFKKLGEIAVTGFSSFFVDVAMGILTVLFNRQIMKYLDSDALAVYATVINISTFVQCCTYSVGQAVPPTLHSHLYAPERRNPCHCACHHPALQRLVRAAAGQHLLDLLFPVHSPPEGFLHRLDCAGASRQRASHLRASRAFCARGNLVGNASDRARDERLRCLCHAEKSDRTLCKLATCVLRFLC